MMCVGLCGTRWLAIGIRLVLALVGSNERNRTEGSRMNQKRRNDIGGADNQWIMDDPMLFLRESEGEVA